MNLGEKIYIRRKELALTLEYVGEKVGVSKSTVKKWETGFIENMKIDKVPLLAKVLQVSMDYLMGWEEHPNILINKDTNELTEIHNKLNAKGQSKLMDYGRDLLINPAYIKEKSTN